MGYFDRLNQLMNMRVKLDNRDTKEIQQIYRDTVTTPKIKMFKNVESEAVEAIYIHTSKDINERIEILNKYNKQML